MNDLIEKLSDIRSQFNCFDENERDAYHTLSEAIKVLSERPETCEDAVSRNAIIQKLNTMDRYVSEELILCDTDKKFPKNEVFIVDDVYEEIVENLPSAQSEIIHCKDCIWYELPSHKITENCVRWMKSNGILLPIKPDDFCSRAERKR